MPSRFEVFTKCPKTGDLVSTGYVTPNSTFNENDKPYGTFNCPACREAHFWSYDKAEIHEVHR